MISSLISQKSIHRQTKYKMIHEDPLVGVDGSALYIFAPVKACESICEVVAFSALRENWLIWRQSTMLPFTLLKKVSEHAKFTRALNLQIYKCTPNHV